MDIIQTCEQLENIVNNVGFFYCWEAAK